MTLNKLVKLTTLWTTGPCRFRLLPFPLSAIFPEAVFCLVAIQVDTIPVTRTCSTVLYLAEYRSTAVRERSDQTEQGPAEISGLSGVFSRSPVINRYLMFSILLRLISRWRLGDNEKLLAMKCHADISWIPSLVGFKAKISIIKILNVCQSNKQ